MIIKTILNHKAPGYISVPPDMKIGDVIHVLAEKNVGAVLVVEHDALVGIVSERDIVRSLVHTPTRTLDLTAEALMSRKLTTGTPHTTVAHAQALMTEKHFRHLPILEHGKLVGLVSIGDVVKALLDQSQHEVDSLRSYVAGPAL